MTDEKFVFNETVKERKQVASGACHKKNGSKSKKCTLPSDHLTSAQKKKLNGPVITWNMNSFYSYSEFKQMPDDIQEAYLVTIINKYHVGIAVIEKYLFLVARTTLYSYISKKEYYGRILSETKKVAYTHRDDASSFRNAINLSSCKDDEIAKDTVGSEKQNDVESANRLDHFEIETSLSFTELVSFISNLSSSKKIKMKLIIDAVD